MYTCSQDQSDSMIFTREPTPEAKVTTKQKLKPSVTPRTFRRFFTPRKFSRDGIRKRDRHALGELTPSGVNSRKRPLHAKVRPIDDDMPTSSPNTSVWEQTKSSPTWPRGELDVSPLKRLKTRHDVEDEILELSASESEDDSQPESRSVQPIQRSRYRSSLGDCLRRQLNLTSSPLRKSSFYTEAYYDTARYYSVPEDVYLCRSLPNTQPRNIMPFCSAACNTNSLVAVGDEDGIIRLLETSTSTTRKFRNPLLSFQAHNNALLDLQFSADDRLLATASGDQACQVIDMLSQKAVYVLKGHTSSVKQIRFQPGSNDSVLATSSRDGSIQIWDLRCNSKMNPSSRIAVNLNGHEEDQVTTTTETLLRYAGRINLIEDAHFAPSLLPAPSMSALPGKNTDRRAQSLQSRSEPSVTALSFLSPSNPHIILSGADSQATVKVWDIRMKSSHRHQATPISTTALPARHNRYRHFGLTSMAVSSDASRLYTLCKDNTVYVYSTAHLTLGGGQETYNENIKPRRSDTEKSGLGPLYGFRHPKIVVSSFYVKLGLRKPRDDLTEMLAVGSSNACAVLIPTDERSFATDKAIPNDDSTPRDKWQLCPTDTEVPIYTHGTALVRGHEKEVTDVAWTSEGNLLTLGDDTRCRVWRSNGDLARNLRRGGEQEGRRWGHGWAEVADDEWDDSD